MRIRVSLLLLIAIMVACSQKIVTGTYSRKFETLELRSDSSYSYLFRIVQPKYISKGSWKMIDDDQVVLNSYFVYEKLPLDVKENQLLMSDSISISLRPQIDFDPEYMESFKFSLIADDKLIYKGADKSIRVPLQQKSLECLKVVIHLVNDSLPIISGSRDSL
jgi:hypothetical protein